MRARAAEQTHTSHRAGWVISRRITLRPRSPLSAPNQAWGSYGLDPPPFRHCQERDRRSLAGQRLTLWKVGGQSWSLSTTRQPPPHPQPPVSAQCWQQLYPRPRRDGTTREASLLTLKTLETSDVYSLLPLVILEPTPDPVYLAPWSQDSGWKWHLAGGGPRPRTTPQRGRVVEVNSQSR